MGRFGSPLGLKNYDFYMVVKGFRENSLFAKNIVSRAVLDPTWHDLGRFWLPFGALKRAKNDVKNMLKHVKILSRILIDF